MASTNIQTALQRIKDLRDKLTEHYVTGLGNPAFDEKQLVLKTSTLADVVDAYNSIVTGTYAKDSVKESDTSFTYTVSNKDVVRISSGYYKDGITISGTNSDEDQQTAIDNALKELKQEILNNATATAADTLTGKTIATVKTNEDGTLSLEYTEGTLSEVSLNGSKTVTDTEGNESKIVVVSANGTDLDTNIAYKEAGQVSVEVKHSTGGTVIETTDLEAGYYPANTKVTVKVTDNGEDIGEINVEASKELDKDTMPAAKDGKITISPSDGYDYIKNVVIPEGSATVTATLSGNKVTLAQSTVEGWIDSVSLQDAEGNTITEIEIPTVESGGEATVSIVTKTEEGAEDTELVVVTVPAGYYDGTTTVVASTKAADNTTTPISTVSSEDVTIEEITATETTEGDYQVIIPAGYVSEEQTVSLGKSVLEFANVENNVVVNKLFSVTNTKGYNELQSQDLTVKEATVTISYSSVSAESDGIGKIVVDTGTDNVNAGWFTKATTTLSDNAVNSIVTDNISKLTDDTVKSIVEIKGENLSWTYENFDTEATLSTPLTATGVYKSATLDVSGLIEEIDSI